MICGLTCFAVNERTTAVECSRRVVMPWYVAGTTTTAVPTEGAVRRFNGRRRLSTSQMSELGYVTLL
jgi:hypothetical protein